jgi:general stress protein 26
MISRQEVLKFLGDSKSGTLATVTQEGKPHADTIYYTVDDNFDISFLTEIGTLKYKNIQYQNDVFFVVTNIEKKITAHIKGTASLVTDKDSLKIIMERIAVMLNGGESFDTVLPILKRDDGNLVVVKISPEEIRFSDYGGNGLQEETFTF